MNVSHGVSSQHDIPLPGKYVLGFTVAKDQTSKRLLQNELDLTTTQKRQSSCSMFIVFFYTLPSTSTLRSCRFARLCSKPHLLCRLQVNGEILHGCGSQLYWFPTRISQLKLHRLVPKQHRTSAYLSFNDSIYRLGLTQT